MSNIVLTKPTTRSIATYCGHFLLRNEKTDVISWYLQCDITLRYLLIMDQTLKYVCGMLSIQRHIVFIDHKKYHNALFGLAKHVIIQMYSICITLQVKKSNPNFLWLRQHVLKGFQLWSQTKNYLCKWIDIMPHMVQHICHSDFLFMYT